MKKKIYHITTPAAWQAAQQAGEYRADSLETEGFIHCSRFEQVTPTAGRHYAGQRGLVVLELDEDALGNTVKYEMAPIGELFPHIYGPIPVKVVLSVAPLILGPDGVFSFPMHLDDHEA